MTALQRMKLPLITSVIHWECGGGGSEICGLTDGHQYIATNGIGKERFLISVRLFYEEAQDSNITIKIAASFPFRTD